MKLVIPEWKRSLINRLIAPNFPNINTPEQSSDDHLRLNDVLKSGIYAKHPFTLMTTAGDQMGRFVQGRGLTSQALTRGYTVILLRHVDILYCALSTAERRLRKTKINVRVNEKTTLVKAGLNVFLNLPDPEDVTTDPNINPKAFQDFLRRVHEDPSSVGIDKSDRVLVVIESHPWAPSNKYCYISNDTPNGNVSTVVLVSHPKELDSEQKFDIRIFMKNIDLEIDPKNHLFNKTHVIDPGQYKVTELKIGEAYIFAENTIIFDKLYYEGYDDLMPWDKKRVFNDLKIRNSGNN